MATETYLPEAKGLVEFRLADPVDAAALRESAWRRLLHENPDLAKAILNTGHVLHPDTNDRKRFMDNYMDEIAVGQAAVDLELFAQELALPAAA